MKKPKIAILVPRFGLVNRGVEVFTKELLFRLGEDFEMTIYSRVKTTRETKKVLAVAETNRLINWVYNLSPWLKERLDKYQLNPVGFEMLTFSVFAFPKLLFGDYDLLFPQNGVWGAIACWWVRAIRRTPFVYRSAGGKEPPIVRQKPNVYIATNPEVCDWIKAYRPEVKAVLIPNGVDLKKFSPTVRPARLNLERPIYLCVAALIPAKRIDLAVKAVSKLKTGSLLVVGDGPLKKELSSLGIKLLGKKRFLIKKMPYRKMPNLYTAADVFTLPSPEEPFGIVYLEALASGLPVVAPNDRSRRYIVGRAGILGNLGNLGEYARVLKKAAELNWGDRPRKQAEKFSWEKIGKKYKKELAGLVGAGR